jgi:hypothetical protein
MPGSLLSLRREEQISLRRAVPYLCVRCSRLFFRQDLPLRARRACEPGCQGPEPDPDFEHLEVPVIKTHSLITDSK